MKLLKIGLCCISLILVTSCTDKKASNGGNIQTEDIGHRRGCRVNTRPVPALVTSPRCIKTKRVSTDTLTD